MTIEELQNQIIELSEKLKKSEEKLNYQEEIFDTTLKESEIRFRLTFENVGAGMALIGLEGNPTLTNEVFQEILQYSNSELTEMTFAEFTHPEDVPQELKLFQKLLDNQIPFYKMEKRFIRKEGKEIWVDQSVSVARDPDTQKPLYAIAIVKDISEKKKALQDLVKSRKNLEQFAYIASHDLQEPLRTITSFTPLLQKKLLGVNEEADQYLTFITEASLRMKELINGLLDLSRINQTQKLESTNSEEVVNSVIKDLDTIIVKTSTQIITQNLPSLFTHKTQFRQLIQNLISNGIKFSKKGTPPIISIDVIKKGKYWQFSITDNGIGIEDKFKEKIFVIFQRLHSRQEYEGTGIGLAQCKKIVEIHGGDIWVESKINEGSTFYFTIPT